MQLVINYLYLLLRKAKTDAIFNNVKKHDVLLLYTQGRNAVLLLDSCSVHHTDDAIEYLDEHNINVIRIPENNTNNNQPLDVNIFGPIKQEVKTKLHEQRI